MRSFASCALLLAVVLAGTALGRAHAQDLPHDVAHASGRTLPAAPAGFVHERHGDVRWDYPRRARDEARSLMRTYDTAWPRLVDELGGEVSDEGLLVRVAIDPEQMQALAPLGAPPPAYASGVAYPDTGLVLLTLTAPETWQRPDLDTLLAHELSHIALERAAAAQPLPRWFVEGLAVAQSGEHPALRARTLWEAVARDRIMPLARLSAAFPASPQAVSVAYAESASFVEWLRRDEMERSHFGRLLRGLRRGLPFDAAVRDGYGQPLGDLERDWHRDLKQRFSSLPLVVGGGVMWVAVFGLAVLAWMRRRRAKRATFARWAAEEATAAELREAARARELREIRERASELTVAAAAAMSATAAQEREAGVPTVLHDGREHTLH